MCMSKIKQSTECTHTNYCQCIVDQAIHVFVLALHYFCSNAILFGHYTQQIVFSVVILIKTYETEEEKNHKGNKRRLIRRAHIKHTKNILIISSAKKN